MRIAYLVSRYPALSHTFIRREVDGMRARGLELDTFSVRATDASHLLSDRDRKDADETWSILPASVARLLVSHVESFLRRPLPYFKTLAAALRHRTPGFKTLLWSLFHFAEAIVLARELNRRNIDHLHTHFANAGGTVGYLATHYMGIPWSLTLHGTADFDNPALLGQKVAATRFTACVSHFGRAQAMRFCHPAHWHKLFIARCSVDIATIDERRRPKEDHPRPRVFSVGRLSPEKGFLGLIDAFAMVVKKGVDAELTIIGEGQERAHLEARVRTHGLENRVSLPGAAPEHEVLQAICQADLFALSSFMEGLPVVLMEALSVEVPVVAPCLAGIPELITHGESGLLFSPGNFSEMAEHLETLLTDAQERAAMGKRGRARITAEFDVGVAVTPLWEKFQDEEASETWRLPAKATPS